MNNESCTLYAIRDEYCGFGQIMMELNDDIAKRNFAYAMSQGQMKAQAKDFSLFRLGTYDIRSGIVTQDSIPQLILTGVEALNLY